MTRLRVPVLMFHHVEAVPPAELAPPPLHPDSYLSRRKLAAVLDTLAYHGHHTLTLAEAAARSRAGRRLPRRAVVLTFDDGCRCFRDHAVPELAAISGLSRAAFARIFQLALGQAPMQYLTEWRMTLARDHLRAGELTLEQIGARTGYASPYAFAAAFRRHHGVPPGQWRQRQTRSPQAA